MKYNDGECYKILDSLSVVMIGIEVAYVQNFMTVFGFRVINGNEAWSEGEYLEEGLLNRYKCKMEPCIPEVTFVECDFKELTMFLNKTKNQRIVNGDRLIDVYDNRRCITCNIDSPTFNQATIIKGKDWILDE